MSGNMSCNSRNINFFKNRYSWGNKVSSSESASLVIDADEKREHGSGKRSGPLLAGAAYCISSCSMILLNKVVLSSYAFNAGISLMFYQNLISTVVILILGLCGLASLEKLNWKLIKVWIPANVIFIAMLVSGMYSWINRSRSSSIDRDCARACNGSSSDWPAF